MFSKSPLLLSLCALLLLASSHSYSMEESPEESGSNEALASLVADQQEIIATEQDQQIVQAESEEMDAAVVPLSVQEDAGTSEDLLVNAEG